MEILLVNDDGIHAPGLKALHRELLRMGQVQVVAPATEQSGVGLGITYLQPLMVREVFEEGGHRAWAVSGSPADCVKLGMLHFCNGRPDLVVSGINSGMNVGINVLYSGTVAGAIEGAFFGVTSIAVSQALEDSPEDYVLSAKRAVRLIEELLEHNPRPGSLWNVNLPFQRQGWPRGVKVVSLGVRRHMDVMEKRQDPRGRLYFWSGLNPLENHQLDPGTDVRELADGYVTITPMHFDLTNADEVAQFSAKRWELKD